MGISDRQVISSIDYDVGQAIALALEAGAVGNVFGYVATSATTIVALRATTYTEQGSAAAREVVSSVGTDGSAGTGARTIRITYYDNNMNGPLTTDVTMNGTSAVATSVSDIRFVECIQVLTAGSNGTNNGTITLRLSGGGATIGTIAASDSRTFWAHHYVAAGRTSCIQRLVAGEAGVSANMFLRQIFPLTTNAAEIQITASYRVITAQPSQIYDMENGLYVPGPARVTAYIRPDANTASTAHGGFTFLDL